MYRQEVFHSENVSKAKHRAERREKGTELLKYAIKETAISQKTELLYIKNKEKDQHSVVIILMCTQYRKNRVKITLPFFIS